MKYIVTTKELLTTRIEISASNKTEAVELANDKLFGNEFGIPQEFIRQSEVQSVEVSEA